MAKSERADALDLVFNKIERDIETQKLDYDFTELKMAFNSVVKQRVRDIILNGKRVDKRAHDEVRAISIETNLLPSVHGSTLFTRGETQALVTITLGDKKDTPCMNYY